METNTIALLSVLTLNLVDDGITVSGIIAGVPFEEVSLILIEIF
jgi:hypothetical protein